MTEIPTDAELIEGSSSRSDLFAELYRRHLPAVLRFHLLRTGDAATAADLAAETFAEAFSSRSRFRDVGAPGRAWLFTIARRQLAHFVRREAVATNARRKLGIPVAEYGQQQLDRINELVDFEPTVAAIRDAMAELPKSQADAVRLRVGDDLPYAEVARRLQISEGAARVRVSRGLTSLAEVLPVPEQSTFERETNDDS